MSPFKPETAGVVTAFVTVMFGLSGSAMGASKPITAGTPLTSGPPAVAVDNPGSALVAWANQQELGGAGDYVQYCVVAVDTTGCSHSGKLIPADSAAGIDGVQVLSEGPTVVILADVFGAAGDASVARQYEPEQEWQSTDGGATWVNVNGGLSVTSANLNADTGPVGAVTLPGTGVLGYGWDTAGTSPPTFNAFPFSSPPQCSKASCPAGFARLEPISNPDQLGNEPGQFASELGANAGVLGIFDTLFTSGPLGCAADFGTAYVYGSGNQSATNNYNVSPGQPNSAWRVPLTQEGCNTERPAVGGGPSGFGILELNDANGTTVYHRLDPATEKFDRPTVTVVKQSELSPSVSQGGAGGIYATYLLGGAGSPIALSYSADGGSDWSRGQLNANKDGAAAYLTSAVNAAGQGWAAWIDNGSVIAQPFVAEDAIEAASLKTSATSNGKTVSLKGACSIVTCSLTVSVSVRGKGVNASLARKKKGKTVKLGSGTFNLTKPGYQTLVMGLKGPGKAFFRHHHGRVRVNAALTEKTKGGTVRSTQTVTVRFVEGKKK